MLQPDGTISSGVPSVVYCRVKGQRTPELGVQGNVVTLREPSNAVSQYEVSEAFDGPVTDHDFFEATMGEMAGQTMGAPLHPTRAWVYDSVPVLVLNMGSSKSQKIGFFRNTLVPALADQVFKLLAEKETNHFDAFQYQLLIGVFEIQDEIMKDLLRPQNQALQVKLSITEGIHVEGLHHERVLAPDQLTRVVEEALTHRTSHALPTGAGIDTSCCVVEIVLRQQEHEEGVPRHTESKLVVVDVPITDKLVQPPEALRRLEGATLNQSLLVLSEVFRNLSNPQMAPLAPYRASKLTHFLQEMLGGNAIVVGLASIMPGEPDVSKATLQLLQTMSRVMHFPVGESQLGLSLRGLLRKYRYLILCLEDELKGNVTATSGQDTGFIKRLQDVEQQLLQAKLERNGAIEDSAQIYQMMELLKAKYKTVLSERDTQAKQLIESEQGRLTVSKSLLEVKLEKTQLLEQAEKDKHELTTQLFAAKNEIFELEAELHQTKTQLADTEAKAKEAEEKVEVLSNELQAVKGAHAEVREQLKREEERNAELGAELLTAVNQREILQHENGELTSKTEALQLKLNNLEQEMSSLLKNAEEAQNILNGHHSELEALKAAKMRLEVELERAQVSFEQGKLSVEKSAADYIREQNEKVVAMRRQAEEDARRLRAQQQQVFDQLHQAEADQKTARRKHRDLQLSFDRLSRDYSTASRELEETREELERVRAQYRQLVARDLSDGEVADQSQSEKDNGRNDAQRKTNVAEPRASGAAIATLMESYSTREARLLAKLADLERSMKASQDRNARLFDKYQRVIDTVTDLAPEALPVQILRSEDDELLDQGAVAAVDLQAEVAELRVRLKNTEADLATQQEKATHALRTLRDEITRLQQERSALREALYNNKTNAPLEMMRQRMQALQQENDDLRRKLADPSGSHALYDSVRQENVTLREAVKAMQQNADAGMLRQLRQTEERCAFLVSRNATLEEQLKAYEGHVRDLLRKRQQTIVPHPPPETAVSSTAAPSSSRRESHAYSPLPLTTDKRLTTPTARHQNPELTGGDSSATKQYVQQPISLPDILS